MKQRDLLEKQEEWADTIEVKPKIKTEIKMRVTPEQSKKVQDICCFDNKQVSNYLYGFDKDHFLYIFDNRIGYDYIGNENHYISFYSHFEEIDADLFIRTNGTCIEEKQEFTYPMWFKNKSFDIIVRFDSLTFCEVVQSNDKIYPVGYKNPIVNHTDKDVWEQVEEPKNIEDNQEDYKNEHYKSQKIDTVARCKANMTLEQQKAICIFNCDKYLHREKGQNLSDIQKVRYYLDWLEEIENKLKDK